MQGEVAAKVVVIDPFEASDECHFINRMVRDALGQKMIRVPGDGRQLRTLLHRDDLRHCGRLLSGIDHSTQIVGQVELTLMSVARRIKQLTRLRGPILRCLIPGAHPGTHPELAHRLPDPRYEVLRVPSSRSLDSFILESLAYARRSLRLASGRHRPVQ